jgi:hypothetical protein
MEWTSYNILRKFLKYSRIIPALVYEIIDILSLWLSDAIMRTINKQLEGYKKGIHNFDLLNR